MGVKVPLNRKQLIEQHLSSMLSYSTELGSQLWPWVSARKVAERIEKCRHEVARAHAVINAREKACDK